MEVEPEVLDAETKVLKSYFTYYPIDLIYKFYERHEYQRLEQRFDLLWEFDISKCFYHIYTHSITWAIKDKESAKENTNWEDTFENRFDKLMQWSNYNETNGIVVGPEISRIFSEIILQQIDLNVLKKLTDQGFKIGIDYEIRRYVDDFFAFSNNEIVLSAILKTYKKELSFYKLYINTDKTNKKRTPFITSISVGKREVKKLISQFFKDLLEIVVDEQKHKKITIKPITNPYSKSQNFVKDFQCIVRQNNLTYDVLNKDIIRLFKRHLVIILKDSTIDKSQSNFENFLLLFLDIIFYCYSLNINTSATFKMAQIIVLITKLLENKNADFKHTVFSKISREAEFVMTTYHRKTKVTETNIETINLLIALKNLGEGYLVTEKKIREYFNLPGDNYQIEIENFKRLNYFQIISLLYYFDTNKDYEILKQKLEDAVLKKFELQENPFKKAEFTCLFFDFICCPFVDHKKKRQLMKDTGYATANITSEIKLIEDQKMWFMNWDIDIDLEQVLKTKEWTSSY